MRVKVLLFDPGQVFDGKGLKIFKADSAIAIEIEDMVVKVDILCCRLIIFILSYDQFTIIL